jgi:chromosomal replication initiation ATPase DnaA
VNNLVKNDYTESGPMSSQTAETLWLSAQELLRTILNHDIFNLWFAPLRSVALEKDVITLAVQNDFCELWLKDNYGGLIQDAVTHAAGRALKVQFKGASTRTSGREARAGICPCG